MRIDATTAGARAMRRAVAAGVILACGLVLVRGIEASMKLTFDKPYRPLTKPLGLMKSQIGNPVRYEAQGLDETLDPGIVDTLGTKEYLLRMYVDKTKGADEVGRQLKLNVNYYGTGSATPHVPEICWAGAGMAEAGTSKKEFIVKGVKRRNGALEDVRMRMISFVPNSTDAAGLGMGTDTGDKLLNVAYMFEVNGKCVAQPQEVMGEFWKASSKYAYHTKVEITVPVYCTQAEAEGAISDFIRASLGEVEACLPMAEDDAGTAAAQEVHTQETR